MTSDDANFVNAETQAESSAADTQSIAGERIGALRVLSPIASGGIATVYKAQHTELEVIRALKVLKPGYTLETKQRFQTEAKVAANLHHPNIVQIHNVFAWEKRGLPCIEMEFVEGSSLQELIVSCTTIPVSVALAMAAIVSHALDFACRQTFTVYGKQYHGLVHRDIKPANILVSDSGVVKLTDFGIALPGRVSIHTSVPGVMGTFPYASPEQINCLALDHRSDIYSLGAVLYELIAGVRAFPQKTLPELIHNKLHGSYVPLDRLSPDVPKAVIACINKSLAPDAEKRFPTLEAFGSALESLIAEQSKDSAAAIVAEFIGGARRLQRPAPPPAARQVPRRFLTALAVPALLAVAAAVGVWQWTARHAATRAAATTAPAAVASAQPDYQNVPAPEPTLATPVAPTAASRKTPAAGRTRRAAADEARTARSRLEPEHESAAQRPGSSARTEPDPDRMKMFETALAKGDLAAAQKFSGEPPDDDGYWHVLLGRYYLLTDRLPEAEQALLTAQTVPSAFESHTAAEAAWYWAECRQAMFGTKPNIENRGAALKAWQNFNTACCGSGNAMRERCSEAGNRIRELGE